MLPRPRSFIGATGPKDRLVTSVISDSYLYGKATDPNKTKELKVRLPVSVHMRLHGLKILGDKSISETVEEALDAYFAKHNLMSERERASQA